MDFERFGRDVARAVGEGPDDATRIARQRRAIAEARSSKPRMIWATAGLVAASLVAITIWLTRPGDQYIEDGKIDRQNGQVLSQRLSFRDGSFTELGDASRAHLATHDGGVDVVLDEGRVTAYVNPQTALRWRFVAGAYSVRVTGTKLAVQWSAEAEQIAISVETGSVEVTGPGIDGKAMVSAGQTLERGRPLSHIDREPPPPVAPPVQPQARARLPRPEPKPALEPKQGPTWKELAEDGRYSDAIAAAESHGFERLLATASAAELALLADTSRYARNAKAARVTLDALERRFPKSSEARLVPFHLGRIAADVDHDFDTAAVLFQRYIERQPRGALVQEARGRLIDVNKRRGNLDAARAAAGDYIQHHPDGPYAALARELLSTP